MAKNVYFEGEAAWAQVTPGKTDKYGNYSIQLFLDPDNLALYTKQGFIAGVKEDEKTKRKYVRFKRTPVRLVKGKAVDFGPPSVFDRDGQPITKLIGNGSKVIVKVRVYDTQKGVAGTLEAVQVTDLIEYNPDTVETAVSGDFKPF